MFSKAFAFSLFAAEFEEPKIGISGKGLIPTCIARGTLTRIVTEVIVTHTVMLTRITLAVIHLSVAVHALIPKFARTCVRINTILT